MKLKSKLKGWVGEVGIKVAAALALPSRKYHKLHNITLKTDRGTTQIDHVIVSVYGIFVVETKFMTGWIFGGQYDKEWTQRFPRSSYRFQNPLRQNYGHVKALENILPDLSSEVFQSVISMCGEHKIKTAMPSNVTRGAWYIKYIRSFKAPVLSESEVLNAISVINSQRMPDNSETKKAHIENIKNRRNSKADGGNWQG